MRKTPLLLLLLILLSLTAWATTDTVVVAFDASTTGAQPINGNWMTFNQTNQPTKVYGTLNLGGSNGRGAVFSLDLSNNTYKVLDDTFAGVGYQPMSPVVQVSGGSLYGTTFGNGTIYKLAQVSGVWTPTILLTGLPNPEGGITVMPCDNDGTKNCLYGTTYAGGTNGLGTIWRFNLATNTLTTLFSFSSTTGNHSTAGITTQVLWNGSANVSYLIGTTSAGGANSQGTLFSYNPSAGTFTNLHDFGGTGDGTAPQSVPYVETVLDGNLHVTGWNMWGTTAQGGSSNKGTLWSLPNGGSYSVLHSFASSNDGQIPYSSPVKYTASNGHHVMLGTTQQGGSSFDGTIWEFDLDTLTESVYYNFTGGTTDGYSPFAPILTYTDNVIRTMTEYGGSSASCHLSQTGCGTIVSVPAP